MRIRDACRRSSSPTRGNCEAIGKPGAIAYSGGWLIQRNRYAVPRLLQFLPSKTGCPDMLVSFFPRPRLFFWSAVIWIALAMALWYGYASNLVPAKEPEIIGVARFWSAPQLWFDFYFALSAAIFAGLWMVLSPHPWARWSILGSALILFTSYFQVQTSVALNE